MARENQANALALVLAHEGGWSSHPADPGGDTMRGITQAVYDATRQSRGLAPRSVRHITADEIASIYDQQYWDRANCDRLPVGLDYAVFDYAVNSGVAKAIKDLQRELRVPVDGIAGNATIGAVHDHPDLAVLIHGLCARRLRFLKSLKTWGTFGRGWSARVEGVRTAATRMVQSRTVKLVSQPMGDAKAPETSVAVSKTKPGIGAIIGAAGVSGQTVIATAQQVQPNIDDSLFGRMALLAFVGLMLIGGGLLGWSFYQRLQEKGAI